MKFHGTSLLLGMGLGMALLGTTEWGWLTTRGVTVQLRQSMVKAETTSLLNSEFHTWGPIIRGQVATDLEPAIEAQISTVLQHLSVSVDGVTFGIPTLAQSRLRQRLSLVAKHQVDQYIRTNMTPAGIVRIVFRRGFSPHKLDFPLRINGIVVPVRIYIEGSANAPRR